jgi:homoserine O-succinyltransferase
MPDAAFADTEDQFTTLLNEAAGHLELRVGLYSLPGLRRNEGTASYIAANYRSIEQLFDRRVDAAIVTGTEPLAGRLPDEPYWAALTELISWAEVSTTSTVLSCLAAHAAVLLFDGIERERLPQKCSGVFAHESLTSHPLVEGLRGPVFVPHSRLNDVPGHHLSDGYASLLGSPEISWTVLARESGNCLFMFVQGHPEYWTTSLLREYKRDLQRYLRGERDSSPPVPLHYLDEEGERLLTRFATEARARPSSADPMAGFPFDEVKERVVNTWRPHGARLYKNWIQEILRRRQDGPPGNGEAPAPDRAVDEQGTRSVGAG